MGGRPGSGELAREAGDQIDLDQGALGQGGAEIPVNTIEQKDSKLTLVVNMVGGRYEAEINKEGSELNGTWTQSGNGLPLKLKKAAAQDKKP